MVEDQHADTSLFSNRFLFKVTAIIGLLAALTAVMTIAGKLYGDRLTMDGHTDSKEIFRIVIGQDVLLLPANMIRFENQRHNGTAESVSLYASWPKLEGYEHARSSLFSAPGSSPDLIFMEFSQSVMSRDMSGRLEPIYSKLFTGPASRGPSGLEIHHMDPKSGFGPEVILTGKTEDGSDYVVRCILPDKPEMATSADCQRDIHAGQDLTLLYRFSSQLLPHWQALDAGIRKFAVEHIQK